MPSIGSVVGAFATFIEYNVVEQRPGTVPYGVLTNGLRYQ